MLWISDKVSFAALLYCYHLIEIKMLLFNRRSLADFLNDYRVIIILHDPLTTFSCHTLPLCHMLQVATLSYGKGPSYIHIIPYKLITHVFTICTSDGKAAFLALKAVPLAWSSPSGVSALLVSRFRASLRRWSGTKNAMITQIAEVATAE